MTDQAALPAAGWYPDPEVAGSERWWNGAAWSDQRRAAVPSGPEATPALAPAPYLAPSAYAPSPYAPPVYGAAPMSPTNGLALAGLIVSCASILFGFYGIGSIVGIVLSAIGLAQAQKREALGMPRSGRGMALAGLLVGIGSLVLNVVLIVAVVAMSTSGLFLEG